jgi:hypothetical protein
VTDPVIQALRDKAVDLSTAVVRVMYQNPFWDRRYGARGRRFAEEDGRQHVNYLSEALAAEDARVLTSYARWLQSVLTNRGMCSRHLADNFALLGEAIAANIPGSQAAVAYLRQAADALVYDRDPARGLQLRALPLASTAADLLLATRPAATERGGSLDDLLYHLSYVADGLALGRPELWLNYVRWIQDVPNGLGLPRTNVAVALRTLAATVEDDAGLAGPVRDAVRPWLQQACEETST